jgi:complex iron-sulfur molybdoenzyme family reductase subunit gamma
METSSSSRRLTIAIMAFVLVGAAALTLFDLRLASSQTITLVAKRSENSIPLDDPADSVWNKGAPIQVPLSGQNVVPPKGGDQGTVTARALTYDGKLYIRMEWNDDTEDGLTGQQNQFSDAAAVQFPVQHGESVPAFCMGSLDTPVNIWQWKATWQTGTGASIQAVEDVYPNMDVDLYPFEDEAEFYPAAFSGNIVARADRTSAADNLLAGSFGTLTAAEDQMVAGQGAWDDGKWQVVFARDLTVNEEYAQFAEGDSTNVAFAVWDGTEAQRDGTKSVSQFLTLEVSSEIATGGGGGPSGRVIGLFVVVGLVITAGLAAAGSYLLYARHQPV